MKTEILPVSITATVLISAVSWRVCACRDLLENGEMLHCVEQFLQKLFQKGLECTIYWGITLLQKYRQSWFSNAAVPCCSAFEVPKV